MVTVAISCETTHPYVTWKNVHDLKVWLYGSKSLTFIDPKTWWFCNVSIKTWRIPWVALYPEPEPFPASTHGSGPTKVKKMMFQRGWWSLMSWSTLFFACNLQPIYVSIYLSIYLSTYLCETSMSIHPSMADWPMSWWLTLRALLRNSRVSLLARLVLNTIPETCPGDSPRNGPSLMMPFADTALTQLATQHRNLCMACFPSAGKASKALGPGNGHAWWNPAGCVCQWQVATEIHTINQLVVDLSLWLIVVNSG